MITSRVSQHRWWYHRLNNGQDVLLPEAVAQAVESRSVLMMRRCEHESYSTASLWCGQLNNAQAALRLQAVEQAVESHSVLQGALFWLFQSYSSGANFTASGNINRVDYGIVPADSTWCDSSIAWILNPVPHFYSAVVNIDRVNYGIVPIDSAW